MSSDSIARKRQAKTKVGRKNVLLVDDDDAVARLFDKILRSASYDVVRVSNGIDAKRLLDRARFDAVVTDISMPAMDGIELLELVRSLDAELPVVVVTGKSGARVDIDILHDHALRYLEKPVRPRELRDVVAEAIAVHETAKSNRGGDMVRSRRTPE